MKEYKDCRKPFLGFFFEITIEVLLFFLLFTISRDCPYLLQMLFKCDHVFTLADVRLHVQSPFAAIHVQTRYRNAIRHVNVARYR